MQTTFFKHSFHVRQTLDKSSVFAGIVFFTLQKSNNLHRQQVWCKSAFPCLSGLQNIHIWSAIYDIHSSYVNIEVRVLCFFIHSCYNNIKTFAIVIFTAILDKRDSIFLLIRRHFHWVQSDYLSWCFSYNT